MKEYSKPKVIIDLEEYEKLRKLKDGRLFPLSLVESSQFSGRTILRLTRKIGDSIAVTDLAYIENSIIGNLEELKQYTFYISKDDTSTGETKTTS